MSLILALDQGTTSSRAILFDHERQPIATAQKEFAQSYPRAGWVEHDPEEIWSTTLETARKAVGTRAADIAAIGITNQRETVVVWERATGRAIHPAIVWQDRRTSDICAALKAAGHEPMISARTGLLLDPYFSATKIAWILDNVPGARARAEKGELAAGTIDSWLLWKLTSGKVHATDASNASRTMLYDIGLGRWSDSLCTLLRVPKTILPEVRDSAGDFGTTDSEVFGLAIAIRGVAGDQQAALFGQMCTEVGMVKNTYGTGCFMLMNTGDKLVRSNNNLLTTVAWKIGDSTNYALEGSVFIAGAAVQWLRDGLKIIKKS
jgi:glycerol kinase